MTKTVKWRALVNLVSQISEAWETITYWISLFQELAAQAQIFFNFLPRHLYTGMSDDRLGPYVHKDRVALHPMNVVVALLLRVIP